MRTGAARGAAALAVAVAFSGALAVADDPRAGRATAQAPLRPCTAADLERVSLVDGHLPTVVRRGDTVVEGPLTARTAYVLDVQDSTNVPPETIAIRGPGGPLPRTGAGPQFALTTDGAGRLVLPMTFAVQLQNPETGEPGERCSASGELVYTVRNPSPVRVRATRVRKSLSVRVTRGAAPSSRAALTYEVRVRRGVARPPAARTRPFLRRTFRGGSLGPRNRPALRVLGTSLIAEIPTPQADQGGVIVSPVPILDRGKVIRYGVRIRVLQGGKVIGGLRSGVVCGLRRDAIAFSTFCRYPGFKARP